MALPTVIATGNLTFDPDFSVTSSNLSRCRLRLACNDRKKQDGEWVDGETTFIDVVLWRTLAETAADNLKKGESITVTGKLRVRTYENKDGNKATAVEIEANSIAKTLKATKTTQPEDDPWI